MGFRKGAFGEGGRNRVRGAMKVSNCLRRKISLISFFFIGDESIMERRAEAWKMGKWEFEGTDSFGRPSVAVNDYDFKTKGRVVKYDA